MRIFSIKQFRKLLNLILNNSKKKNRTNKSVAPLARASGKQGPIHDDVSFRRDTLNHLSFVKLSEIVKEKHLKSIDR